jgi:hypothetical protein
MTSCASYTFEHIERMSDARGLFEHAEQVEPRIEHGYCTDDNARLLVVASREPDTGAARRLSRLALRFVLDAQDGVGRSRNRLDHAGRWTDRADTKDWWGRAVWGLGVAAVHHRDPQVRQQAMAGFARAATRRSRWPRAMAFATLGAVDVAMVDPHDRVSRSLLSDALEVMPSRPISLSWRWPEARLAYANATLAEAVMAAGAALGRDDDLARGLSMLAWLLELEMDPGHLSVAGASGRDSTDRAPQFDQQPIEVAALADACWRAYALTNEQRWADGIAAAARWFEGVNDVGLVMHDETSGGGYDGLHADRVNENQGAESTLAYISTMQRARSFVTTS